MAFVVTPILFGEVPRVLPAGQVPKDARLQPLKDLDGYFPFTPPSSPDEWAKRAELVKRRVQVSQGLWPMPTKTPLKAVIHGRVERTDYTVEKVYFESFPGFFVTGNLYRPTVVSGKVPGVLFAHGHWANARLTESTDAELHRELAEGEERFEEGGRSRFQSMCVQLARMGCVVFQYDMLGNSDSQQISMELAHSFGKQRPEMNTVENWGLFSPQAESHAQSIMGLQTWNSIRSLDFLLELPEVDPERLACTGASGGGTQTMMLGAIDPRLKLSFPAVMVSTSMQGGCTCENASLLRIGTGNVEFAGLFAPKPQGMTSANDWTKEMSTKGFPELKNLYKLLGAPENVVLKRGEHFPHNYNAVSRGAFYNLLNRHFKLGKSEPVLERDYQRHPRAELTVWDASHPQPQGGPDFERKLLRYWHDNAQSQLKQDLQSVDRFKKTVGGALDIVLDRALSSAGEVTWDQLQKIDHNSWLEMRGLIRHSGLKSELPTVFCYPKTWNGKTVVYLTAHGKSSLYFNDGALKPEPKRLVDSGAVVVGVDLLYQGEFMANGQPLARAPKVKNPREAAAYSFGYNNTVFVQRVHDVLSVVRLVRTHEKKSKQVAILGVEGAGPIVAAARALAGAEIDIAAIDSAGFRFGTVPDIFSPDLVPGGAKYLDLPGMLALSAPNRLWLGGETGSDAEVVKNFYKTAGAEGALSVYNGSAEVATSEAVSWLLNQH
jgi:dienelactone hydrolase